MSKVNVFIVDDEQEIRILYEKLLRLYGFKVVAVASNGEQAVYQYKKFAIKPDVIIMDYKMPVKDGLETTEEILKLNKNQKIIIVSGDYGIKNAALSIGTVAFEEKPVDFTRLIRRIIELISAKSISLDQEPPCMVSVHVKL